MATYTYPGAFRAALLDELHRAGIADARVEMDDAHAWVATEADEAAVAAVVNAHDPSLYDQRDANERTRLQNAVAFLKNFRTITSGTATSTQKDNAIKAITVVLERMAQELRD